MFIHHRHIQARSKLPSGFIIRTFIERTDRTNHRDFRILFFYCLENHFKTLLKNRRNQILVSNTDVLQVERFRMACFCTHLCPFILFRVTIGIFYQVQNILHVCIHLFHGNTSLLSAAQRFSRNTSRILTWNTCRQHWKRLCSYIFTELEILKVSQT